MRAASLQFDGHDCRWRNRQQACPQQQPKHTCPSLGMCLQSAVHILTETESTSRGLTVYKHCLYKQNTDRSLKGLNDIALCWKPTSQLRDFTCHMGSHRIIMYGCNTGTLCLVHTCHKMAPLNSTILWRHKIAPFFEAINLLLQNLWRHKLPLS